MMQFRTSAGDIVSENPMSEATGIFALADPNARPGEGQVETAQLLRKQIERVIRENSQDPKKAALAVCVILDENLSLAADGYFDDDEMVIKAILDSESDVR